MLDSETWVTFLEPAGSFLETHLILGVSRTESCREDAGLLRSGSQEGKKHREPSGFLLGTRVRMGVGVGQRGNSTHGLHRVKVRT